MYGPEAADSPAGGAVVTDIYGKAAGIDARLCLRSAVGMQVQVDPVCHSSSSSARHQKLTRQVEEKKEERGQVQRGGVARPAPRWEPLSCVGGGTQAGHRRRRLSTNLSDEDGGRRACETDRWRLAYLAWTSILPQPSSAAADQCRPASEPRHWPTPGDRCTGGPVSGESGATKTWSMPRRARH